MDYTAHAPRARRPVLVTVVAALFILVAGMLGAFVKHSIDTLTITADRIDDARATTSASGAIHAMKKSLAATLRDNAFWDEAARQLSGDNAVNWVTENWASTTLDYPLYDTAIVLNAENNIIVAYHDGVPIQTDTFFTDSLKTLIADAHRITDRADDIPIAFIRSRDGISLIGAAPVVSDESASAPLDARHASVVVFAKHLTRKTLLEISESFTIEDLALTAGPVPGELSLPLPNADGQAIAYFSWPRKQPGTAGYARVAAPLKGAALALVLFLMGLAIAGAATIRHLRRSEMLARRQALHDPLTGLANRAGLAAGITSTADNARRAGLQFCLHLIDLDGFKGVNDAWGHPVGDLLLKAVAERLLKTLAGGAVLYRLGGDEFALLSPPSASFDAIGQGQAIRRALYQPFPIGDRDIRIGASVGFAIASVPTRLEPLELVRRADIALYKAKAMKDGTVVGFEDAFDAETQAERILSERLRLATPQKRIFTVFHPLIDASTQQMTGVEALARWRDEDGTVVSPETFIPIAEKYGLIDAIGLDVLRHTLIAAKAWPSLGVSVNVSPIQLRNPRLAEIVLALLAEHAFNPRRLTLEVTEGIFITDPDRAAAAFDRLRADGVRIALDDFGSGFASVGRLRHLPFDRLKIDRSMITALDTDDTAPGVLQATVALATALGIPVTAEGVETDWHAHCATLAGCSTLQGYLYGAPVSAEGITCALSQMTASRQA